MGPPPVAVSVGVQVMVARSLVLGKFTLVVPGVETSIVALPCVTAPVPANP